MTKENKTPTGICALIRLILTWKCVRQIQNNKTQDECKVCCHVSWETLESLSQMKHCHVDKRRLSKNMKLYTIIHCIILCSQVMTCTICLKRTVIKTKRNPELNLPVVQTECTRLQVEGRRSSNYLKFPVGTYCSSDTWSQMYDVIIYISVLFDLFNLLILI